MKGFELNGSNKSTEVKSNRLPGHNSDLLLSSQIFKICHVFVKFLATFVV